MRVLPRSLFGRLMLVLASGLIVAQLLSAAINLAERDSAILRASGMQPAQRIADIVKLLDSLRPADRDRIAAILNVPPLVVSLDRSPLPDDPASVNTPRAVMFSAVLRAVIGDDRPIRVAVSGTSPGWATGAGPALGPGSMRGPMGAAGMHRFPPPGVSLLTQVRLQDGTWATFDTELAQQAAGLPWRLLLTLGMLLATVLALSWLAVRWITRPLHVLASAADELGRDIHRAPLPERGPTEVSRAARAFNTMQARLARLIEDRTRTLTAMSHDLKTPITRMRLRAELLEDDNLREKFEKDLLEMETMVTQALEFMRGVGNREPRQLVDIMGLLESLQADHQDMGRTVTLCGRVNRPCRGDASLLRRCISNLIDNAVLYGTQAEIGIEEQRDRLTISIRDRGPGIPQGELEKVFEPFYRLEGSRSRETGGTGFGLTIARNIARAHGGDVRLGNRAGGGLEAILSLPWEEQ